MVSRKPPFFTFFPTVSVHIDPPHLLKDILMVAVTILVYVAF